MPELVALTGATGFIGSAILHALSRSGVKIKALSRKPRTNHDNVRWINGDLDNQHALESLVDGVDSVIHCAGAVRGRSAAEFLHINNGGTERLIGACQSQSNIQRFLLISSLAARQPELSWYANSKYRAEETLKIRGGIFPSWTIFRPTAVYGPGDKEIRPLLLTLKRGLLIVPNAETSFSLLHINDLVSAIKFWSSQELSSGEFYELDDGTANGYNWHKLMELARQNWGKSVVKIPIPLILLKTLATTNLGLAHLLRYSPMLTPGKIRELSHPDWTCDNTKIRSALHWQPTIQLSDAMRDPALLQL